MLARYDVGMRKLFLMRGERGDLSPRLFALLLGPTLLFYLGVVLLAVLSSR
jgi:hypothetical protein